MNRKFFQVLDRHRARAACLVAAALIACAASASCAQKDGGDRPPQADVLDLSGQIDSAMVARVRALDFSKISYVRISSRGGDDLSGIAMARRIKESGRSVQIYGYCGSACLMIAMISSPNISLDQNALFTIGNTAASSYFIAKNNFPVIAEKIFKPRMEQELRWAAENSIDPRVLLFPQIMIDTKCVVNPGSASDRPPNVQFGSKYLAWALTQGDAQYVNIRVGGLPRDGQDLGPLSALYFPDIPPYSILNSSIPDNLESLSFDELGLYLSKVPECTPSIVNDAIAERR